MVFSFEFGGFRVAVGGPGAPPTASGSQLTGEEVFWDMSTESLRGALQRASRGDTVDDILIDLWLQFGGSGDEQAEANHNLDD